MDAIQTKLIVAAQNFTAVSAPCLIIKDDIDTLLFFIDGKRRTLQLVDGIYRYGHTKGCEAKVTKKIFEDIQETLASYRIRKALGYLPDWVLEQCEA